MQNTISIRKTSNGAVVRLKNEELDEEISYTYEEGNLKDLRDLLFDVRDFLLEVDGRYQSQRIKILIEHGDKFTCQNKDCKICKENDNDM